MSTWNDTKREKNQPSVNYGNELLLLLAHKNLPKILLARVDRRHQGSIRRQKEAHMWAYVGWRHGKCAPFRWLPRLGEHRLVNLSVNSFFQQHPSPSLSLTRQCLHCVLQSCANLLDLPSDDQDERASKYSCTVVSHYNFFNKTPAFLFARFFLFQIDTTLHLFVMKYNFYTNR